MLKKYIFKYLDYNVLFKNLRDILSFKGNTYFFSFSSLKLVGTKF